MVQTTNDAITEKMLHQKETKAKGKMVQTAKTTATMLQTPPTKAPDH